MCSCVPYFLRFQCRIKIGVIIKTGGGGGGGGARYKERRSSRAVYYRFVVQVIYLICVEDDHDLFAVSEKVLNLNRAEPRSAELISLLLTSLCCSFDLFLMLALEGYFTLPLLHHS